MCSHPNRAELVCAMHLVSTAHTASWHNDFTSDLQCSKYNRMSSCWVACHHLHLRMAHLHVQVTKRHRSRKQIKVEDATQDGQSAPVTANGLVDNASANSYDSTQQAFGSASSHSNPLAKSAVKPRIPKRKQSAISKSDARPDASVASVADAMLSSGTPNSSSVQEQAAGLAPKKKRRIRVKTDPEAVGEPSCQAASGTEGVAVEAVAAAVQAVAGDVGVSGKKPKRRRIKASEVAVDTETELVDGPVTGNDLS